jgi:predicted transcriptional regulator
MIDENGTGVLPARREKKRGKRRSKAAGESDAGQSRKGQGARRSTELSDTSNDGSGAAEAADEKILIELSKAQVDQVVRNAGQGGTMSVLLSALRDPDWTLAFDSDDWAYPAQMEDRRLSRSLLSGLLVLSCFSLDGEDLGIAELARMLNMNTSTTHRYVTTLLAVGLLERDSSSRRYRLASQ